MEAQRNLIMESVLSKITLRDLLMQAAEESCEFAQACHKVARSLPHCTNQTRISNMAALHMLNEEAGDVLMCMDALPAMLGLSPWLPNNYTINNVKWHRWDESTKPVQDPLNIIRREQLNDMGEWVQTYVVKSNSIKIKYNGRIYRVPFDQLEEVEDDED